MRKIREILRLRYEAGLSEREIARAIGASRTGVRKCLRRATAAGVSWPLPSEVCEVELERRLYPRAGSAPEMPLPDFAAIHADQSRHKGMTRLLAWEEYKEKNPGGLQYSAFCERYREWLSGQDVVLRQPHPPASALFVDYAGETAEIIDRVSGETRRVKLFVAVLGHSNLTYVEATMGETTADWLGAQVRALEYIGGVPKKIVPDNPKALITRASRYEPDLNPSYQDFAEHYQVAVLPARVATPRDKAKVETGVQIAERWILARLRNQTFFTLADLNAAIRPLLDALNEKPFQKLDGSRRSRFEESERAALDPLPERAYVFAVWRKAKIHLDYHVEIERHHYSTPYTHAGKTVDVLVSERTIEVFHRGALLAVHVRSREAGQFTTIAGHRPERHRAVLELNHETLLERAEKIGPSASAMISRQLDRHLHPQQVLRSSLGILRLAKDHSPQALEQACQRALDLKTFSYRAVQALLRGPSSVLAPIVPVIDHENIRGASYYGASVC